jgi:hypothetical protein
MATARASSEAIERLKRDLADRNWRLCNLYWILDRDGNKVRFEPNWAQQRLMEEWHYRNIVLKSRQIGFTTFIQLLFLDLVLFNSNMRCGTIAQDRDTAKAIFQDKIKQPYDWLPDQLKAQRPTIRDSVNELALSNNSVIRVGTSMRGGSGTVHGALIGALVMASLDNGMSLMDVDTFWQMIVKGSILVLAVWVDVLSGSNRG